jgi:hypothetical protein
MIRQFLALVPGQRFIELACGSKAGFGLNARFSAAKCLTDGPHRANIFCDEQTSMGRPLKGS